MTITEKQSVHFDEETHTYTVDGRVVPSVTQVIQEAGLFDTTFLTDEGRIRGSKVAIMTDLHDRGELDESRVEDGLRGYLDAWKEFLRKTAFKILEREEPKFNATMAYCGTPDIYGVFRCHRDSDGSAVIDIKSGNVMPHYSIQTVGYQRFYPHLRPRRFCLYLGENGKHKLMPHTEDSRDWDVFCGCVWHWYWKKENLN